MRPGVLHAVLLWALLPALGTRPTGAQVIPDRPAEEGDPRSIERLYYGCHNELGRRDVTLFGNGTVRLRSGLYGEERMDLAELGPDELAARLAELARVDPTDGIGDVGWNAQLDGQWVERCALRLALPGREVERHAFSRFDTLTLRQAHAVQIAERLAERARPLPRGLPRGYVPAFGDVLIDRQGKRFRVLFTTFDGDGIELEGLDQPLRLVLPLSALGERFVTVEPAAERAPQDRRR